jgi:hypothetical protein
VIQRVGLQARSHIAFRLCPDTHPHDVKAIFFSFLFGSGRGVTFRHDRLHNLFGQRGFFGHRLLRGFLALADQLALELQPRAFLSARNLAGH